MSLRARCCYAPGRPIEKWRERIGSNYSGAPAGMNGGTGSLARKVPSSFRFPSPCAPFPGLETQVNSVKRHLSGWHLCDRDPWRLPLENVLFVCARERRVSDQCNEGSLATHAADSPSLRVWESYSPTAARLGRGEPQKTGERRAVAYLRDSVLWRAAPDHIACAVSDRRSDALENPTTAFCRQIAGRVRACRLFSPRAGSVPRTTA